MQYLLQREKTSLEPWRKNLREEERVTKEGREIHPKSVFLSQTFPFNNDYYQILSSLLTCVNH